MFFSDMYFSLLSRLPYHLLPPLSSFPLYTPSIFLLSLSLSSSFPSSLPLSLPLSLSVSFHFVNSHFVNVDKVGIDKVGIKKAEINKVGMNFPFPSSPPPPPPLVFLKLLTRCCRVSATFSWRWTPRKRA